MKKIYFGLLCALFSYCTVAQPDISLESFSIGFNLPLDIKHAGDDRLFIVEQSGLIQILNSDGSTNTDPFLDIQSSVPTLTPNDERGLLGLAFHPDYSTNGFFYVNYSNLDGDTVISRFSVGGDPNLADSGSEVIILTLTQPYTNHNGGNMVFGPDGYLYIGTGDGGSGGDPEDRGQDLSTLLGKILRIDVDGGSPYAIPSNNPFENDGDPATLGEIWAYGLRNPWKFSFDSLTDDLWIADVGQSTYEEINKAALTDAGLNYGWRCYEANSVFNLTDCPGINTLTFPIAEYSHFASGNFKCSITGGFRHRGSINTNLNSLYFFADYCSDEIGILEENGPNWDMTLTDPYSGNGWSSFGEDINGELYIAGLTSGIVYKIVQDNLRTDSFNISNFKMYPNPSNSELTFDFKNTYTPDRINIYDIQGKLLQSEIDISNNLLRLSIHDFAKGLYLVEVLDINKNRSYKKLLVN